MMKYLLIPIVTFLFSVIVFSQTAEEHYAKGKEIYENSKGIDKYSMSLAIEQFTLAIKKKSSYLEAYEYRGNLKSMLFDFKGAIKDYTKIIQLDPKNRFAYEKRAFAYNLSKNYNKALKDYNKAIELAGENTFALRDLYYSRAGVRFNLNQKSAACDDLSKAGELGNSAAYEMIKQYCN